MIKESTIERLKQSIDIVSVAENYVVLKKNGANFKANCPLHGEKTPSFVVSPAKQIFHCFGCGAGGDGIKLTMEIEKLSYPEAIEKLCDEYNIPIEYESGGSNVKKLSTNGLELYKKWCYVNLKSNTSAMQYLRDRGVSDKSIDDFEIGYSPSSDEVVQFMSSTPIPIPESIEVGILGHDNGRTYARFSNRIMFPIRDHIGKLCGFSGRTTVDHPAKYLNTADTPLFNKSSLLYGLDRAKDKISKLGYFIVCEGQMDVVMMHQVGIVQSFASMGTALTDLQVKRIKRYAKKGIVAYDGDKAGVAAAFKATELLMVNAVDSKVVTMRVDEDPAAMISSGRVSELKKLLSGGVSSVDFVIDKMLERYNLQSPFERTEATKTVSTFASKMMPIVQSDIVSKAEEIIGNTIDIASPKKTEMPDDIPPPMAEMEIIKAIMISEDPKEIAELESAAKCFVMRNEIAMLRNKDYSSRVLTSIYLNDRIVPSADVISDIILLKVWCMKRYLMKIQHNNDMSAEKKIVLIREAQVKIMELENKKE